MRLDPVKVAEAVAIMVVKGGKFTWDKVKRILRLIRW
jgi:hypothetical protein